MSVFTDKDLTWESAKALAAISGDRVTNFLISYLTGTFDLELRTAAAYGLSLIKDGRAVEPLLKVLSDKKLSFNLRAQAAESLSYSKEANVVKALIKALNDESPEVKFCAAYALGQIGDAKAIPFLEKLAFNCPDETTKWGSVSSPGTD